MIPYTNVFGIIAWVIGRPPRNSHRSFCGKRCQYPPARLSASILPLKPSNACLRSLRSNVAVQARTLLSGDHVATMVNLFLRIRYKRPRDPGSHSIDRESRELVPRKTASRELRSRPGSGECLVRRLCLGNQRFARPACSLRRPRWVNRHYWRGGAAKQCVARQSLGESRRALFAASGVDRKVKIKA